MSLFSVFDPISYLGMSMNWMSLFFVVVLIPVGKFIGGGIVMKIYMFVSGGLGSVYSEISFPNGAGMIVVSMVLFIYISVLNVFGLFPFYFSCTGHVMVTFSLGLIFWIVGVMMGWVSNFVPSVAHLVPEGSPIVLSPFMVVIELVSQMIRPITLSVRLAANMMAGHLIVGLISSISMIGLGSFFLSVFFQSMMLILEWAVCFIQAFVFSVLVMLYVLDYY